MLNQITDFDLNFETGTNDFDPEFEEQTTDVDLEFQEIGQVIVTVDIHNELQDRDAKDAHPISSITGLNKELDDKVSKQEIEAIPVNTLVATDELGNLVEGIQLDDAATKDYVNQVTSGIVQDIKYTHNQLSSSSLWSISHNLNKMPSVTVVDSAGSTVVGEIIYVNNNEIQIRFTSPFSGKAYLN